MRESRPISQRTFVRRTHAGTKLETGKDELFSGFPNVCWSAWVDKVGLLIFLIFPATANMDSRAHERFEGTEEVEE